MCAQAAGSVFMKHLRRTYKCAGEEFIDRLAETAETVVFPPYKKFRMEEKPARGVVKRLAQAAPSYQTTATAPPYFATASPSSSPSFSTPPPAKQVGISQIRPGAYEPKHFARPCCYCNHGSHAGSPPHTARAPAHA